MSRGAGSRGLASRVLVVTAVPPERDAATARLGPARSTADQRGYGVRTVETAAGTVAVASCGIGPAAAGAGAAALLGAGLPGAGLLPGEAPYDLVVCAGIAGGFAGRAAVGDVVVASRVVHADLGADSPGGFLGLAELGFGETEHELGPTLVATAAARTGGTVGPVLTVSTATGTDDRAALLAGRHRAVAEAMEGAGVHAAARAYGVPMLEVRTVSNLVGRRDRASWNVPGALAVLGRALAALLAEPLMELLVEPAVELP
ncbi:MAG TPA: futalosine hydrolase [Mycobacteriales bacterium]|nr:futalosine hydrolase [Mycobacteriales bacterium]